MQDPNYLSAFDESQVAIEECAIVFGFMSQVAEPLVGQHAEKGDPFGVVKPALHRATWWLHTMWRLNHPADFQAAVSGSRALFEIALDLMLLESDREAYPALKLRAWEASAKLRLAETILSYAAEHPESEDDATRLMRSYAERSGPAIQRLREKFWPTRDGKPAKHPPRWTNRDLRRDARAADALGNIGYEHFYARRYQMLCWSTHGSGFTAVRGMQVESTPLLTASAFLEAAEFGMHCARYAVAYVEAHHDAAVQQQFADAEQLRFGRRKARYAELRAKGG